VTHTETHSGLCSPQACPSQGSAGASAGGARTGLRELDVADRACNKQPPWDALSMETPSSGCAAVYLLQPQLRPMSPCALVTGHTSMALPMAYKATHRVQIGAERARTLELQEGLAALRARVAAQRRAMGGVNAAREGDLQARQGVNPRISL
jgi:hypothetical protein